MSPVILQEHESKMMGTLNKDVYSLVRKTKNYITVQYYTNNLESLIYLHRYVFEPVSL